jgi:para-nitrobenzyl esterase
VAFHASELPYIFGQIGADAPLGANWPRPPRTEAESRLSDAMMSYWVSFVRTGVPKAPGEAAWPRFNPSQRGYLDIEDRPIAREALQVAAFAWASDLVASRLRQGRRWQLDIGFAAYPQR